MTSNSQQRQALGYGIGAVALWSTVATAFKYTLGYVSPLVLVTIAATVSWVFFAAVLVITGQWRQFRTHRLRDLATAFAIGLLNPVLYYLLLFAAYDRLPAQEAMALNYTWALTLPLLAAPLLGHSLSGRELVAAAISYAGVYVIATRGEIATVDFANPSGVLLALASTLVWALYWIANTRHALSAVPGLFLNFSAAIPLLLVALWLTDSTSTIAIEGWAGGFYIGLFEMGISFILWLTAMKLATSTVSLSTLIFLSPPISLVIIWLVLGEPILLTTLMGLGLILLGLWLQHSAKHHVATAL